MLNSANDTQQATYPLTFPYSEDILRIILEAAVEPEDNTFASLADNGRLSLAYNLCLVNKRTARWIEPLLYAMVSLGSERQVNSFSYTLKNKSPNFLSRRVRALWLFEEGVSLNHINFAHLFVTLRSLETLLITGYWASVVSLAPTHSSIRDLILVEPQGSYEDISLRHLSLRSLHIVDSAVSYFSPPAMAYPDVIATYVKKEILHAQLEAIPRICIDFTRMPPYHPAPLITALMNILKDEERSQMHRQAQTTSTFNANKGVNNVGPSESRSLWIKTNPADRSDRRYDMIASMAAWDDIIAVYKQSGPLHRPVCGHSLLGDEAELMRIRRLPWTQRVKESIRYNELHWDEVAKWCETEGAKEIRRNRTGLE